MHGPCGIAKDPNAPCMQNGNCSKRFPFDFQPRTDSASLEVSKTDLHTTNFYWNYRFHINLEICNGLFSVKYLKKKQNVCKGHDRAEILVDEVYEHNENRNNVNGWYTSTVQPTFRLFKFQMYDTLIMQLARKFIWKIFRTCFIGMLRKTRLWCKFSTSTNYVHCLFST